MAARMGKLLARRCYSTPAASLKEAMVHLSSAANSLRTASGNPPDFDAQLASAQSATREAHAIVRELDKYEEADHVSLAWPLFNCLGLLHHLRKEHTAATEALRNAVQSVEAGARQGLAHDAYVDIGGALSDLGCTLSAAGETDKAQAAFGRALYMCSRAYHRDSQTIGMIHHNMAAVRLVHSTQLESAIESIEASVNGLAPSHSDKHSGPVRPNNHTRGQALLIQALLAARLENQSAASINATAAVPLLEGSECADMAIWLRDRDQNEQWQESDSVRLASVGHPQLTRLGEGLVRCLKHFEAM